MAARPETDVGTGTSERTDPDAPTTVAVILAAGAGSRFDGPAHKLTVPIDGMSVIERAVTAALGSEIGPVVVVIGDHPLPPLPAEVAVVHNPRAAEGQATSVQAGVDTARRLGASAVVIGLGDQPFVTSEAWRAVAAASAPIAVATYDGQRGNPVRLAASMWDRLPRHGDEGARSLIRMHPDLVEPVPCSGSAADIDTREDLERWQNRS